MSEEGDFSSHLKKNDSKERRKDEMDKKNKRNKRKNGNKGLEGYESKFQISDNESDDPLQDFESVESRTQLGKSLIKSNKTDKKSPGNSTIGKNDFLSKTDYKNVSFKMDKLQKMNESESNMGSSNPTPPIFEKITKKVNGKQVHKSNNSTLGQGVTKLSMNYFSNLP